MITIKSAGDTALLFETSQLVHPGHQGGNEGARIAAAFRAADVPGVVDVVPGASTVLVTGLAHLGVPASGAADAGSLRLANELVGNDWRQAPGPAHEAAFAVPAGTVLRLGAPATGLRSYLAIGGGIEVPPVLGSRSADLLSGLGPPPLRPGDLLPVGRGRSRPVSGKARRPLTARPVTRRRDVADRRVSQPAHGRR